MRARDKVALAGTVNPQVVERLLRDKELHRHLGHAVGTGRGAYARLGKHDRDFARIAHQIAHDRKTQRDLIKLGFALRAVAEHLREEPKKKKKKKTHRVRTLVLVGSAAGLGAVVVMRKRRSRERFSSIAYETSNGSSGVNAERADTGANFSG